MARGWREYCATVTRFVSRKPSSDGQVFLDFLAQEVLWCHQRCEQISPDEMQLGHDFISYARWLNGLVLELKSRMCFFFVCAQKNHALKAPTVRRGERYAFMLDQIATQEVGTQGWTNPKKSSNRKQCWDELRWVVKRTSEKMKYYPVGLSRKDSEKTITNNH